MLAPVGGNAKQTGRHRCEDGVFPSTKAKKPELRKTLGMRE